MITKLRKSDETDFDFAFKVKKDALGPYIADRWGWDEVYQLSIHRERWKEKPWFIITLGENRIGTVSINELEDSVRFGEFYLLNQYQGKGIGTNVLSEFLDGCNKNGSKVKLEYLKWNPVGSLYLRHGFKVISENDAHYFMERIPNQN